MRIFASGIATESNTFSPIPTAREDFMIRRGRDVLAGDVSDQGLDLEDSWGRLARQQGHEFVFGLMAWAQPSGTTTRASYESLREELLAELRASLPVDVVLLMLHGAMVAQGYDDCEEDIIRRVREIVGSNAVIGVEFDLHCHLSESTIAGADIIVTYKEYPHVDINDRARELYDLAIAAKLGKIRPTMALFDCRMVGLYPTTREPLRSFVDAMSAAEKRPGVLSLSFGHGFQHADVPHLGAKILVVTDDDRALGDRVAEEFGRRVHALRREIGFESLSLPMHEALLKALTSNKRPIVVADQSDNTGGGAPGDATFALRWLLDCQAEDVAMAIFYDPEVVKTARKAGIGATLPIRLGGKLGVLSGSPIDLEATVIAIRDNYQHAFPQQSGAAWLFEAGNVVALRCGSIDTVVSSERCQCFGPDIFTDLGIDPEAKKLLVVKSVQHFYAGFSPIAGEVIYMSGPGAVPPDPRLIAYRRVNTARLYPWSENPFG